MACHFENYLRCRICRERPPTIQVRVTTLRSFLEATGSFRLLLIHPRTLPRCTLVRRIRALTGHLCPLVLAQWREPARHLQIPLLFLTPNVRGPRLPRTLHSLLGIARLLLRLLDDGSRQDSPAASYALGRWDG